MRSPRVWFLIAISLLLPWQIAMVARDPWFRLPPKPVGDGPDYENVAYHLSRGEGWSLDWSDPRWRAPYLQSESRVPIANGSVRSEPGAYAAQLARSDGLAPTTGRPPLLPALIALIYCAIERGPTAFACVRILLAGSLAVAGALATALSAKLVATVTRQVWPVALAACTTMLLALLDRTVRTYATDFLTEPLALLLLQLWLWCMCELLGVFGSQADRSPAAQSSRVYALATLTGILLALLIYTRSIMALWLPGVWLLLGLAGRFSIARRDRPDAALLGSDRPPTRRSLGLATRVIVVCAVLCAPWWIRNCLVLESWMPLGTQGPITLVGGYSDEALLHQGEWQIEPEQRLRAWAEDELSPEESGSIPRREARIAREAGRTARDWAGQHVVDLPKLAIMRVVSEWNPYSGRALVWKLLAMLGLCWLAIAAPRAAWILGGLVVLNTLCIMLLYSVGGRFLVPLYGVLYTLAGLGLTGLALGVHRVAQSCARSRS